MPQEINERGKHFTDVIRKKPLRVNIRTINGRIDGSLHIRPGNRLLDELNEGDAPFLAVTDVKVLDNGATKQLPFLALRKGTIEWIGPIEEPEGADS